MDILMLFSLKLAVQVGLDAYYLSVVSSDTVSLYLAVCYLVISTRGISTFGAFIR